MTRAAFGTAGAPLNETGINQARALHERLMKLGIDFVNEPVAVSELMRTHETAKHAGFQRLHVYDILNEVNTSSPELTMKNLERRILPPEAIAAARRILANPPTERYWVTHGLIIAALCAELGQSDSKNLVPDFCSVSEIIC
jgi:broad specificity phosphatase PhoE